MRSRGWRSQVPGGGREGSENGFDCVLRESVEELGLKFAQQDVVWSRRYGCGGPAKWFFVVRLPGHAVHQVRFGDEGQRWTLMSLDVFVAHPKAVPVLQERLREWVFEKGPPAN